MRRIKKHRKVCDLTPQQQTMFGVWNQYFTRAGSEVQVRPETDIYFNIMQEGAKTRIIFLAVPADQTDGEFEGLVLLVGMDGNGAWDKDFFTGEGWSFDGSERRQQIACLVFALGAAPLLPLREDAWPQWEKVLRDLKAEPQHLALIRSLCEKLSPMFFEIVKQTYNIAEA
jgi:hypothetical protein